MPVPEKIDKAYLQVISWDENGVVQDTGQAEDKVEVQFNPETLKMTYSNQISGDNNNGGSAIQFSSQGTTKLAFDLWFDVSAPDSNQQASDDVGKLTDRVLRFMKTSESTGEEGTSYTPPGCRFQWGTFLFEGVMDSVTENLEFFSDKGKPLRASMSVSMTKQTVELRFPNQNAAAANQQAAGTQSQQQAQAGDSVQNMSAREGQAEGWQNRALSQGIEDPMRIAEGTSQRRHPLPKVVTMKRQRNRRRIPCPRM